MVAADQSLSSHSMTVNYCLRQQFAARELKRSGNRYIVVTLRDLTVPGIPAPPPPICLFNSVQQDCIQSSSKGSRRSAYGEQAGTEHSGHLPEHCSQRQNPHYHLSGQWREAYRKDPLLRQVLGLAREQQPGAVDLQARYFNRGEQSERHALGASPCA